MAGDVQNLFDLARVHLPGSIDPVLQLEFANVLLDFCERTNAYNVKKSVPVTPGVTNYRISLVDGVVNRLLAVVDPTVPRVVEAYLDMPDMVVIPCVQAPGSYDAYLALLPDVYAPLEVPEYFYTRYRTALMSGLIARMMVQPSKPYSNSKLAGFHESVYLRAVSLTKSELLRRFTFNRGGAAVPRTRNGSQR